MKTYSTDLSTIANKLTDIVSDYKIYETSSPKKKKDD